MYEQAYELVNNIQDLFTISSSRKHKILRFFSFTFTFRSHFLSLCKSLQDTCGMENAIVNENVKYKKKNKCKKGRCNFVQRVKILLVNKDENAAAVFSIFTEYHSKVRNGDSGFTSAE